MNSPIDYLLELSDLDTIEAWRRGNLILCTGQGAWEETPFKDLRRLKELLEVKGIPARIEFQGEEVNHDWPWWRIQMRYFLDNLLEQNQLNG